MINVLIVDDSRTARDRIALDLSKAPDLRVCGMAGDGKEGVRLAMERKPDVVLMDLLMPGMDGCEATRAIMSSRPTPVIVMTSQDGHEATRRVFESGAVDFFSKGRGSDALRDAIRTMAKVKVVGFRVRERPPRAKPEPHSPRRTSRRPPVSSVPAEPPRGIVFVGASTGGPQALQTLLSSVPVGLPVAFAVVLHIARGFYDALSGWLRMTARPTIKLAEDGEPMRAGVAYFAPDNLHLEVGAGGLVVLSKAPPRGGMRPAVDVLFESAARHLGRRGLGLLLTGMGADGARGLLAMRQAGAMTLTQDEASCVVYGMPSVAEKLGASVAQFNPTAAAAAISVWAHQLPARPL